jgi:hypothetical protein
VVVGVAPSPAGRLTLVRSLSRSTWLAQLDGAPVVARVVTAPPNGALQDPLLVPVIGSVDLDGTPWLVSEHVDGTSVQRLLSLATLSASQAAYIVARTLAGLATLHAAGRAHGRLCAGNVLVDRDGTVQLSDWALGTDAKPSDDLAAARQLITAMVRNADRPAARRGELLHRLEDLAATPITDAAAAAGELENALGDPATVADELGVLVGASNRPPGGVVAAAPLPPRLPHDRRPLTRGPAQRRLRGRRGAHAGQRLPARRKLPGQGDYQDHGTRRRQARDLELRAGRPVHRFAHERAGWVDDRPAELAEHLHHDECPAAADAVRGARSDDDRAGAGCVGAGQRPRRPCSVLSGRGSARTIR